MQCIVVGAGTVASEYSGGMEATDVSVAAVCDLEYDRAADLAESLDANAYDDLDAALAGESAPLVVNLTSHEAHATVTRQALAADRHVYSEKPLAMDADTAQELVTMAEERGLALGCAPGNHRSVAQRHAATALADGRTGPVRLGYAHAHVGRVTEWHGRPDSFLSVGPLYDGGVYPLTLLVAWFGPVRRVRVADSLSPWPESGVRDPERPTHVEATLEFDGPVVRLTASTYAPHRSREFYGLELHGDDGSLYVGDTGALVAEDDSVQFGRLGSEYVPMPPPTPDRRRTHLDGVERLARITDRETPDNADARRAAHIVAVCNAIETAAESGDAVDVDDCGADLGGLPTPAVRPPPAEDGNGGRGSGGGDTATPGVDSALRLPPVGFGCSRYRDGEYVDRTESIATALDAGYRLLDSAELYGNEHRIGSLLAERGSPDRDSLFLVGKVWNTNHEHVREACEGSLRELQTDAFDCYMLHWPDAWEYQGPLERLAEKPVDEQERLTFPERDGEPATADVSLEETWRRMEELVDDGLARTLGICNVSLDQLDRISESARIPPAVVQVERHPYSPRNALVETCHERGIRVVAHSPLSASGLLVEPALGDIGEQRGLSPAQVVLAWNVTQGVVPIPSSNDTEHVVANLAAAGRRLSSEEMARIAELRDTEFER